MNDKGLRLFLYSHDGLGLGHLRRNLAIAREIANLEPGASILLATGTDEFSHIGLPGNIDILKLPALRKVSNGRYTARYLQIPSADILALRSTLLTTAIQMFRPSVMLVDKHPVGVNGELCEALDVLLETGGRTVLGLRAILDDRATVLKEWTNQQINDVILKYYDRVLIYGDRNVFDPVTEYGFPLTTAGLTQFCGYVVNRLHEERPDEHKLPFLINNSQKQPTVLATPGGGEDGFRILKTFINAAMGEPWKGIVVTGPMMPDDKRKILMEYAAEAGVSFYVTVPNLDEWFGYVDALVCMGGYNTIVEAVFKGTPTVCIPRTYPRTEQLIRARAFEKPGLIRALEPERLNIHSLRLEVDAALRLSREDLKARSNDIIDFDGARKAAENIIDLSYSTGKFVLRTLDKVSYDKELMSVVKKVVQEDY